MSALPASSPLGVTEAARRLAAGELVAFPTETVYGLGARADDDIAVGRIFSAKGRPPDHPLIVHVSGADAASWFADLDHAPLADAARRLMASFWPGPLTLILPRRAGRAQAAAGGQQSIGLRVPDHPLALSWLHEAARLGVPGVAGPSANRFGRVSPTTVAHVAQEFGDGLPVLDGGACEVGIESTIVDCSRTSAALLRPGRLGRAEIERVLGHPLAGADADSPRASGTLASHYAPAARVRLMASEPLAAAVGLLSELPAPPGLAVYSRQSVPCPAGVLYRRMPSDAGAAARELFAALRDFDDQGALLVWVEAPPPLPDWDGVRDRLQRAAA